MQPCSGAHALPEPVVELANLSGFQATADVWVLLTLGRIKDLWIGKKLTAWCNDTMIHKSKIWYNDDMTTIEWTNWTITSGKFCDLDLLFNFSPPTPALLRRKPKLWDITPTLWMLMSCRWGNWDRLWAMVGLCRCQLGWSKASMNVWVGNPMLRPRCEKEKRIGMF